MKRALALVLTLAGLAFADETTKLAKIDRFFQLTDSEKMLNQQLAQMRSIIQAQIPQSAAGGDAEKITSRIMDLLTSRMNWERMKPGLVKLYSEVYSEEELDGIIAFYLSPAGKAMLAKTPVIMQRSMQLGVEMMGQTQAEIQKIVEESTGKR